ncbi:lipid-transfer protein [Actinomadura logoneensis]|uniref:Lipid-transfer protein n=1 Tax=Actinomadura logoneensis TaxID=2293572 RepID=A0A372JRX3_9ACTN|nr:thiolase domain-containing protein [Actinomadura logoneensis]RFU42795.1 lipid-transfer protein [Actinomadura logoneensis]
MRPVAVVAFTQTRHVGEDAGLSETELLAPLVTEIKQRTGITRFGFTCSGSNDYLAGAPFSFVSALDAVGAWPPISESHVEMDAAWALYEAWVKLQHGGIDTALVYGFGKTSQGDYPEIVTQGLDPYYLAPLGVDQVSLAALQARAYLDHTGTDETRFREIAARARSSGRGNPSALHLDAPDEKAGYEVAPLRPHDVAPVTDGAAVIVLAAGDRARELAERPAWITGIDHRSEPHQPGFRDLASSPSARLAAERAGGTDGVEIAELHTQFSHEELILRDALGLGDGVAVNPSGGPLSANPVMATGLIRIGEAAARIAGGTAGRVLAHAASGPCLQQNLVCVMSGEQSDG